MTLRSAAKEKAIIDGVSLGKPLSEVCRDLKIGRTTIHDWMDDADFAERMGKARALGFDALVDQMLEIADDSRNDWLKRKDAKEDMPPVRNPENVARARLRIETRMRILARWYPRGLGGMMDRMADLPGSAGPAGPIAGPEAGAQPLDTTAIAVRLSSILATIAARDPAEDGWDGDGFGDGDGGGTIVEHEEDAG